MRNYLLLLLLILLALPTISTSAEIRTLEIDFSFGTPSDPVKQLVGYRLYQEGKKVCETDIPNTSKIICDLSTENGTYNFALAAYYSDNSQSPLSPSFPFTIGSIPSTPVESQGDKTINYTWEENTSGSNIVGHRMYMNDTFLCQTIDSGAASLSCSANLINGPMAFTVTSFDINNIESSKSNILMLNPTDFPELFRFRNITQNWDYTNSIKNEGGFRLYNNGDILCKTTEPSARQLTCEAELSTSSTNIFTMTAVDASGIETALSNAIIYNPSTDSAPDQSPLQAVVNPTPASGEIPLYVSFAGSASTGDIATYSWEFGDGTTGTGSVASHTYSIAGTYTAMLTVQDQSGASHQATAIITAQPSTVPSPEPPTAVLSSSTAAGNAPLLVNFDGTSSTTSNPPIVSYSWTFGDGSQATGETTSHTFTTAGTYYTELTIIDSKGLSDKIDTPIIVVGSITTNEKPNAVLSANPPQGEGPLTVSFDGSQSSDPDGTIVQYDWNFGDGSTATGPAVQHTYTGAAVYTVSLMVTDDKGETATATKEISCNTAPIEGNLVIEVGEVSINHEWVKVLFENTFSQPIVVAGPPTANDKEQVLIRIRNIDQEGFEVRLQEWDYLDNIHTQETFSYVVIEKGKYTLPSGVKLEAGDFAGAIPFQKISLQQTYDSNPVILTQIMTDNETDAVTGRIQNINQSSFEYKLQEMESATSSHVSETVGYIAWEASKGEFSGLLFEAGNTTNAVTHNWFDLTFGTEFPGKPLFIAGMQTYAGSDTAAVRTQNLSQTTTQVKVEEDQSLDTEINHAAEAVGYLAISAATATPKQQIPTVKLFTFTWEYKNTQNISGYRFYLNGNQLCESTNPDDRQIACNASLLNERMEFTMTTVSPDGSESTPSNLLDIDPAEYPALFFGISLATFSWDFDKNRESSIKGFGIYNNDTLVCKTDNPSVREITCATEITPISNSFNIKAIDTTGSDTEASNTLSYRP